MASRGAHSTQAANPIILKMLVDQSLMQRILRPYDFV